MASAEGERLPQCCHVVLKFGDWEAVQVVFVDDPPQPGQQGYQGRIPRCQLDKAVPTITGISPHTIATQFRVSVGRAVRAAYARALIRAVHSSHAYFVPTGWPSSSWTSRTVADFSPVRPHNWQVLTPYLEPSTRYDSPNAPNLRGMFHG